MSLFLKILGWTIGIGIIVIIGFIILLGRIVGEMVSEIETQRVVSPSGKIDAVVIEADGGATTSVVQRIYVVQHGKQPSSFPDVILDGATTKKNDENSSIVYGLKVKWDPSNNLILEYVNTKRSEIRHPSIEIEDENIHIKLHPENL